MTARLRLLCHAATAATRTSAFPDDEPAEAREHGRIARLTLPRADVVLTSPARAARETATLLGLDASVAPLLADLDSGRWRGRPFAGVAAEEPDAVTAWTTDPTSAPHGGESIVALVDRIAAFMVVAQGHRRLLGITHAGVLRAAIVHVVGAPAQSFWAIDAGPLGFADFSHDGRRWRLRHDASLTD